MLVISSLESGLFLSISRSTYFSKGIPVNRGFKTQFSSRGLGTVRISVLLNFEKYGTKLRTVFSGMLR